MSFGCSGLIHGGGRDGCERFGLWLVGLFGLLLFVNNNKKKKKIKT